ncbi:hypothetical protein LTR37_005404 [Vermiconidia calcicola]|uniref:Uncharacterized protein n=1 Tax=Vermiconidia calcicola TaxID=1690605 RepID=A0ACC3NJK7_9PEZI|nr:hypothetical protein LTR37_005404 [Vermiconidia calcicola]
MATPVVQVFDTVELLETILLELPTRDLLLSQRVNKQWAAVIQSSRKLQQALFLESVSRSPMSLGTVDKANCTVRVNPLLQPLLDFLSNIEFNGPEELTENFEPWQPEDGRILDGRWLRRSTSWRRMFLTQPPTMDVSTVCCIFGYEGDGEEMLDDTAIEGCSASVFRMGTICDELDSMVEQIWRDCGWTFISKDASSGQQLDSNQQLVVLLSEAKKRFAVSQGIELA